MSLNRVIISGGGTGGHVFPAIAIADALRKQNPNMSIHFIGALGKMEMERVPLAGYTIDGLNIQGFKRKQIIKNFTLPFNIIGSLIKARNIIKKFNPELVIGVGGYASGPTLKMASWMGIKTVIQEQNSFPGKTNMLLAKRASAICVAYENMHRFFPKEKIHLTGNPVRQDILSLSEKKTEGLSFYDLEAQRKTVLLMGGSLGAKTLNQSMVNALPSLSENTHLQVLWQCGKTNYTELALLNLPKHIKLLPFIDRMDLAYACADIIVSRAGATSISELTLVGKPCFLIPSPNVTEDHQTKNAMALVEKNAAVLISDKDAPLELWPAALDLLSKPDQMELLSVNIKKMALPNSAIKLVQICESL